MVLRIAVAGSTGKVGRALVQAIVSSPDYELTGAVARKAVGQDAGTAIGLPTCGTTIAPSVLEALRHQTDVLIDYTHPRAAKQVCLDALSAGCAVVIGSSGLEEADFHEIDAAAQSAGKGVIAAGNFSISARLMKQFALEAARHIADFELVDYASASKPDVPSGTATELAEALASVRMESSAVATSDVIGHDVARGAAIGAPHPVQVHGIRLPSYELAVEAIFAMAGERLTLRHEATTSAQPYVVGTLLAAKAVVGKVGLVRGLDSLF